tara:strand:+ start:576 stop:761 length:186 start_codon:yes stop_codon:yes gene_type:complete
MMTNRQAIPDTSWRDGDLPVDGNYDEEDDGQPSEYEEYQDVYGGDDWDQGQYDYYDGGVDF